MTEEEKKKKSDEEKKKNLDEKMEELKKPKREYFKRFANKDRAETIYQQVLIILPGAGYNVIDECMNYNEEEKKHFHFKNGYYDFKDDTFKERTANNYTTVCLKYKYKEIDENIQAKMDIIYNDLKKIHPNEKALKAFLHWTGYCLTGYTEEEKMLYNVGITASNGKSTKTEFGNKCFPCYWCNIDSKAFNKDNNTPDKTFQKLLSKPMRKLTIEEGKFNEKSFNVNLWKQHVSGNSITVKPLYQPEIHIPSVHYKLEVNSNYEFDLGDIDEGVKRRGIQLQHNSQFFKDENKVDVENHKYLADKDMIVKFNNDDYKLAYFHLLKEYAVKYTNNKQLEIPDAYTEAFKGSTNWVQDLIHDVFQIDASLNQRYTKLIKKNKLQKDKLKELTENEKDKLKKLNENEKEKLKKVKEQMYEYIEEYDDVENFFNEIGVFEDDCFESSHYDDYYKEFEDLESKIKPKSKLNTKDEQKNFIMKRCFFDTLYEKNNKRYNFSSYEKQNLAQIWNRKKWVVLVNTNEKNKKMYGIKFKNKDQSIMKYAKIYKDDKEFDSMVEKYKFKRDKGDITQEEYEDIMKYTDVDE